MSLARTDGYPSVAIGPYYSQERAGDREQQVGIGLSIPAAWCLVHFTFDAPFAPSTAPLVALAAVTAALTVAVGAAGSRDVFAETPLVMLRAE